MIVYLYSDLKSNVLTNYLSDMSKTAFARKSHSDFMISGDTVTFSTSLLCKKWFVSMSTQSSPKFNEK